MINITIENNVKNITFDNFSTIPNSTYTLYEMDYIYEHSTEYNIKTYTGFKDNNLESQDIVFYTKTLYNNNSFEYMTLINNFIKTKSWDLININNGGWVETNSLQAKQQKHNNIESKHVHQCTCNSQKISNNQMSRGNMEQSYSSRNKVGIYKIIFALTDELKADLNNDNHEMISFIIHGINILNLSFSFLNTIFKISILDLLLVLDSNTSFGDDSDLDNYTGKFDNIISSNNYDIGHVLGNTAGGLAGLGVVGNINHKGAGYSGLYYASIRYKQLFIDYLAHEVGHQMHMNHPQEGTNANLYIEPFDGSTIMAYAGLGINNVQMFSDYYFNSANLKESLDFINTLENIGVGEYIPINTNRVYIENNYNSTEINKDSDNIELRDFDNNNYLYSFEQNDYNSDAEARSTIGNKCYRLMNKVISNEIDAQGNPTNTVLESNNTQSFRLTKYKRNINETNKFISCNFESIKIFELTNNSSKPTNMPTNINYEYENDSVTLSWDNSNSIPNAKISVYAKISNDNYYEYSDNFKFASGIDTGSITFDITPTLYSNLPGNEASKDVMFKVLYDNSPYYRDEISETIIIPLNDDPIDVNLKVNGIFNQNSNILTIRIENIGNEATSLVNGYNLHPIIPLTDNVNDKKEYLNLSLDTQYIDYDGTIYYTTNYGTKNFSIMDYISNINLLNSNGTFNIDKGSIFINNETFYNSISSNAVINPGEFFEFEMNCKDLRYGKYLFSANDIISNPLNTIEYSNNTLFFEKIVPNLADFNVTGSYDNSTKNLTIKIENIGIVTTTGYNNFDYHVLFPVTDVIDNSKDCYNLTSQTPLYYNDNIYYPTNFNDNPLFDISDLESEITIISSNMNNQTFNVARWSDDISYSIITPVKNPGEYIELTINCSSLPYGTYLFSADDILYAPNNGDTNEIIDDREINTNNFYVFEVSENSQGETDIVEEITLNEGWNLISSSFNCTILDENSIIISNTMYEFNNDYDNTFTPVTELEPNHGYYIKTSSAGTIKLVKQ